MGIDAGFDMVPPLSKEPGDRRAWERFINSITERYEGDDRVDFMPNYIEFNAGEHPMLPLEGHKLLRFSAKVSGRIAAETGVEAYIRAVTRMATLHFGSRVQVWNEGFDVWGHYDWSQVNKSWESYEEQDVPEPEAEPLFEVAVIPGKGRGLVARVDVAQGTRILCEELLLIAPCQPPEQLERVLASKLKAMPKDKQRQFLSLHNNHPGRHAFGGIVRTNALPCGPGSPIGGVYPTISLINHSCLPNSHNNWNGAAEHETIHATRLIKRGEEITISYEEGKLSADRRQFLKDSFGFLCECPLCNLPPAEVKASDDRRRLIQRLDDRIGNPSLTDPNRGLRDCRLLLETLRAEYGDGAAVLIGRLYYDAFQLSVMHMAEARARIFAERGYETRVICEGEDSPETQRIKALAATPSDHRSFGILSSKLRKEVAPKGLGEEEFETWLFGERS